MLNVGFVDYIGKNR